MTLKFLAVAIILYASLKVQLRQKVIRNILNVCSNAYSASSFNWFDLIQENLVTDIFCQIACPWMTALSPLILHNADW